MPYGDACYRNNKLQQYSPKERLEELYVLVCHWLNAMFGNYANLTLVMKKHTDYNQYLDSIINSKAFDGVDFNRLEMIVGIYGRSVQTAYNAALQCRDKINEIEMEHKTSYRRGESGERFLAPFSNAQLELISAGEQLKTEIANAAKNA